METAILQFMCTCSMRNVCKLIWYFDVRYKCGFHKTFPLMYNVVH